MQTARICLVTGWIFLILLTLYNIPNLFYISNFYEIILGLKKYEKEESFDAAFIIRVIYFSLFLFEQFLIHFIIMNKFDTDIEEQEV